MTFLMFVSCRICFNKNNSLNLEKYASTPEKLLVMYISKIIIHKSFYVEFFTITISDLNVV